MIKAYKLSENVIQSVKIVRSNFMALDGIVVASLAKELQENFKRLNEDYTKKRKVITFLQIVDKITIFTYIKWLFSFL